VDGYKERKPFAVLISFLFFSLLLKPMAWQCCKNKKSHLWQDFHSLAERVGVISLIPEVGIVKPNTAAALAGIFIFRSFKRA
jgi:hypothetical protein